MVKYFLPLWLAAWPAFALAASEPAAPLTLHTALALAAEANADLSAARHELAATDGAVQQAGLLPNPTLEVERVDRKRADDARETTFLLSQPLELGGKRGARMQAAEHTRDSAAAALGARQAEIRANVIDAWFAVLAAQEQLRLAQESSELAQRAAQATGRRVIAGKVSPVEETRAKVAAATVTLELLRARSELAVARKKLTAMWGNPSPRFDKADGDIDLLPSLPDQALLHHRLAQAPAMALARSELASRQSLAQVELSKRVPDITLNLGRKRSEELGRSQLIVGFSVPLPLFDRNQGNVLETARRVDKARDELSSTALRLDSELAQACEDFDLARAQALALRTDIVPGAQSAYAAASTGFENGKFGFLDVLDAQRTLLEARSQYLNALAQAHRAHAAIIRILGAEQ
ncbi:cobalt-zinc-cadmium efflux system outer membrane protein [Duganella sp. 3397]|uniref:TolC family protein n=1 Tax=Duganella sp. 3397 TaxID=2817732 RepID=UPI002858CBAE|nr:TolC family protein [Duganella sp. 3397]MDR7047617.1 cobalt-zinc-cadmium efflux system outer membrane protein [Duganella sp. 3397]